MSSNRCRLCWPIFYFKQKGKRRNISKMLYGYFCLLLHKSNSDRSHNRLHYRKVLSLPKTIYFETRYTICIIF
ncbi:hypothetical protein NQ314_017069 [Rhamnusium bicolor]|uniref:Uncharacterized protein n=1 Tax=Rhamnusium bicolor TaxID=1586634 RepID=A0AAV8WU70_9CUCU|nr:hypothetical protein NQ314_017069 [Rhamnusium bicolor]